MNSDLFLDWLKHFVHHVKPSAEDPVLLIADNHSTHCSLPAILYCRENHITFLTLPPHASHVIQPLDKGFYGPLKTAYAAEAEKWLVQHPGQVIKLTDLAGIFKEAYSSTAKVKLAEKAFQVTGIEPFDPDVIDDELFAPSLVTDKAMDETTAKSTGQSNEAPSESAEQPSEEVLSPSANQRVETDKSLDPSRIETIYPENRTLNITRLIVGISTIFPLPQIKVEVGKNQKRKRRCLLYTSSYILCLDPFEVYSPNWYIYSLVSISVAFLSPSIR